MSEDLPQIRGDWKFHIDYVQNAIDQTLKRVDATMPKVDGAAELGEVCQSTSRLWAELKSNANDRGTISTTDGQMEEFIEVCRSSKPLCDSLEDSSDSANVEELAEACRQARALCDDLELLQGQRPDDQ